MPVIQSSVVIGKNDDGSDITQDVDVLVWWSDVENEGKLVFFSRQFLTIPGARAGTGETGNGPETCLNLETNPLPDTVYASCRTTMTQVVLYLVRFIH